MVRMAPDGAGCTTRGRGADSGRFMCRLTSSSFQAGQESEGMGISRISVLAAERGVWKRAVRIPVVQPDFLIRRFGCDDYFFLVFRMVKLITRPFMDVPFRFVVIHVDADGRFAFGSFVGTMGLEKGGLPLQGFRRCAARVFGEENAFGIYFAGMYFYRFIRQLKDVFTGSSVAEPRQENLPGTPGPGMSRDTGAE